MASLTYIPGTMPLICMFKRPCAAGSLLPFGKLTFLKHEFCMNLVGLENAISGNLVGIIGKKISGRDSGSKRSIFLRLSTIINLHGSAR